MPRPPPDPALVKRALSLAAASSPKEAAETLRAEGIEVGQRTIYEWQKKAEAAATGQAPTAPKPPSDRPPPSPRPEKPAALVSDLALVRRILGARDPAALAELDAGFREAMQGEEALVAWLARPLPTPEDDEALDPVEAVRRALSVATNHLGKIPPLHARAASLSTAVANLAARLEKIVAGRPQAPTADEVTERINRRKDDAIKMIMQYTSEARAKLDADVRDMKAWARENMAPKLAEDFERRLAAMLCGAT